MDEFIYVVHLSAISIIAQNSGQVIAPGKAVCNFDCCKYNFSLIALKCMRLPSNHIALRVTLSPYP